MKVRLPIEFIFLVFVLNRVRAASAMALSKSVWDSASSSDLLPWCILQHFRLLS